MPELQCCSGKGLLVWRLKDYEKVNKLENGGTKFMTYREYTNKLINRFLLHGKKFVDYSCFQYGEISTIVSGEKK